VGRGCGVLAACIASIRLEAKATTRRRKPAPHTSKWCGNGCVSAVLPPDPVPPDPGRTFSGCDLRATGDQGESREGRRMTGNGAACSRRPEVAGLAWGSPQGIPPVCPRRGLEPKNRRGGRWASALLPPGFGRRRVGVGAAPAIPSVCAEGEANQGGGVGFKPRAKSAARTKEAALCEPSANVATPTTRHPRRAPRGAREGDPVIAVGAEWIAPVFPGCPRNPPPT
jgi:hypothetical protein